MTALGMPAFAFIAPDKAATHAVAPKSSSRADASPSGAGDASEDGSFGAILSQKDQRQAVGVDADVDPVASLPAQGAGSNKLDAKAPAENYLGRFGSTAGQDGAPN